MTTASLLAATSSTAALASAVQLAEGAPSVKKITLEYKYIDDPKFGGFHMMSSPDIQGLCTGHQDIEVLFGDLVLNMRLLNELNQLGFDFLGKSEEKE